MLFDLDRQLTCEQPVLSAGSGRPFGLTHLVYAIPTGDDTILFLVSTSNNPAEPTERMATDLVLSMTFEGRS